MEKNRDLTEDAKFIQLSSNYREESEGGVVFNFHTKAYIKLNKIGFYLWRLIPEKSLGEITSETSALYSTDRGIVMKDVTEFLQNMIEMGLIRIKKRDDDEFRIEL